MRKIIVPALAALSLAAISTPASAETVTVEVSYGDLNLSSQEGMKALERRVERAIERMCGSGRVPIYAIESQRECVSAAKASAGEQIARLVGARPVLAINVRR